MNRFLPAFAGCACALLWTTAADFARGGLVDVDLFNNIDYEQTSGAAPTTSTGSFFDLGGDFQNAGDFDSVTVSFPGPGSPVSPMITGTSFNFGSQLFATQADLQAAFPLGTYTFTASNSITLASQTGVIDYTANLFTTAIPALAAATYNGLQGMNPAASFAVNFDSFTPDPNASQGFTFFTVYDPITRNVVFTQGFLDPSVTSVTIPANTLAANTQYGFELDFSDRLNGLDSANNVFTTQGFDVRTDGLFTTGAAQAPEPASGILAGIGALSLVRFRVRRRKTIA